MGAGRSTSHRVVAICDLDGTLIDSDRALVDAFVALGVAPEEVTFGHVLADECARLGISVTDYLDAYDEEAATPFPGVVDLVAGFDRWAVVSNKQPVVGRAELARLRWTPEQAMFSDSFNGPKSAKPMLHALGIDATDAIFLGDTAHDRRCANDAGVRFALAGWNPRATAEPGDLVLADPCELLELLGF
jgi:HAD superfamily hydrolase (TIGR01549 family)